MTNSLLRNKKKFFLVLLLFLFTILLLVLTFEVKKGEHKDNVADFYKMSWYHPVLMPSLYDIIAVGTVIKVKNKQLDNNTCQYQIDIRIDEKIYLSQLGKECFKGKSIIRAVDSHPRVSGDRIIVMTNNTQYQGYEFSTPEWSGSNCDIGIALHSRGHVDSHYNEKMINNLREFSKSNEINCNLLMVFSHFCPMGVARYYINELRKKELGFE